MKKILFIGLILAGCNSSTGVIQLGPDTFQVATSALPGAGGSTAARKLAYKEAGEYCVKQGKNLMVQGYQQGREMNWGGGLNSTMEVTFMCLSDNDKDLKRPMLRPAPDMVIENR